MVTNKSLAPLLLAGAALLAAPQIARAQVNNNNSNPLAPFGNRPGAIPLLGTGQNTFRGGQIVPTTPVAGGGFGYQPRVVNGVIVPPNGSFTPNPYGGGGVIINNNYGQQNFGYGGYAGGYYGFHNGVAGYGYPSGYGYNGVVTYSNGYAAGTYTSGYINNYSNNLGYNQNYNSGTTILTPNGATVVVPRTSARRNSTNITNITTGAAGIALFGGYAPVYTAGQTVLSPFGAFYNSPPYIGTRYIVGGPYPYLTGRETRVLGGITFLGYGGDNTAVYGIRGAQTGTQAPSVANVTPGVASDSPAANLTSAQTQLLQTALGDLQTFWEKEDPRALRRRLPSGAVGVFQNNKFAYSLGRTEFLSIASDALDHIQTRSFEFKRVAVRNDGLVNAYATHTYAVRGAQGGITNAPLRSATARVTFLWQNNDWVVSSVSFAPGTASTTSPAR